MKKFILSLGLIAMAFNLTNCAQNEEVTPSVETKGDFALYATVTKTANDGVNTIWSAGDQINVFHAVGETTTYVNDTPYTNGAGTPFVCNDATTGYFLGAITGTLDPEEEYDWYAFYPYSSYINTPANNGSGYRNVGSPAGIAQVQIGNDSMAHIAGENYPMAGYAVAVPANQQPHLTFTHISSLVEFEVTNKLAEAITVTEIQFTAGVDIVGSYYINFADSEAYQFTSSGANYVSNTALLTVTNGTEIAANASAKFYAAIKPFTANAGSNLEVVVSATSATGEGTHVKTITLTDAVEFKSGKIKPVKVNYTTVIEAPAANETTATLSFADKAQRTSQDSTQQTWEQNGIKLVNEKGSSTSNVGDYANPARFYKSSKITITAPGNITKIEFTASSSDYATALKNSVTATEGTASISGTKVTIIPASQSNTFVINSLSGGQVRASSVAVTYVTGGSSEGGETPEAPAAPVLSVNPTTLSFDAASASQTVICTIDNEVSGVNVKATSSDTTWLTATVNGKTVTITATENTGTARNADVTIAYDGAESKIVTVSQEAASTEPENPSTGKEVTTTYTFSNYAAGAQYAKNEAHKLDDILTITTTACHFTSELRIYSSSTNNGYAIGTLAGGATIKSLGFNAGNKVDTLNVYGSTDGSNWTLVSGVSITSTSYKDYSLDFGNTNYTYFKLDVDGSNQVRLKSLTLTYID